MLAKACKQNKLDVICLQQQADAAKPEAIVGADAVHAPLDASAPPPAEAAAPPSASLGGASPAEGEAEKVIRSFLNCFSLVDQRQGFVSS
uniref:DUF4116 domain-containing protein n=1 Tax=Ascaris lumbricoides TaxID=6252 RepID=A0A0M3HII9_ASCLU